MPQILISFANLLRKVEKSNEGHEKGILEELSKHPPMIPWLKRVENATVTEAYARAGNIR